MLDLPGIDRRQERVEETGEPVPGDRALHFEAFDATPVADVMTAGVITVSRDAPLGTIARLMTHWKVHRVFVEDGGEIVGVVTSLDVLKWVDRALPAGSRKAI
jgi:predicted transcriptional regulator